MRHPPLDFHFYLRKLVLTQEPKYWAHTPVAYPRSHDNNCNSNIESVNEEFDYHDGELVQRKLFVKYFFHEKGRLRSFVQTFQQLFRVTKFECTEFRSQQSFNLSNCHYKSLT